MSGSLFRFSGSLRVLGPRVRELADRSTGDDPVVREAAATILARVRADGDAALRALARELDGVDLEALEVPRERARRALAVLPSPVRSALERAARNIETAHRTWLPTPVEIETEPGVVVGRRADPLDAIGVYAPGGRAAYPSSVLMGAIPARVAGVATVVLCSPPGSDGAPSTVVLAAAELAGVDRIFALGGAGAIAAMAFGTPTIPRVERIVGPGNAYVAEAKRQVAGMVGIDSPAGPSELLIIADESASPDVVARECLAQAEHDPRAAVVIIAATEPLASAILAAIEKTLPSEPRRDIICRALATGGGLLWVDPLADAIAFANEWAPEHLLLATREPERLLSRIRHAGTVFLGETSSVAFGDYMTGANHVLPTGGAARGSSGLSTLDFVRWTTYQRVTRDAASRLAADVAALADAEGLPAHAAASRAWSDAAAGVDA